MDYEEDYDKVLGAGGIGGAIVGGASGKPLTAGRLIVGIIVLIILLIIAYWAWLAWRGLGGALTKNGWVLWTMPKCPACASQRLLLGSSYKYVAKKQCLPGSSCPVTAFPTWTNSKTGEKREGVQNPAQLHAMAK